MARDRKLKAAFDRFKGVDHNLERQRKLEKQASKRKKQKTEHINEAVQDQIARENQAADAAEAIEAANGGEVGGWVTDESEAAVEADGGGVALDILDDESDSESDIEGDQNGEVSEVDDPEDEIPLSDIESLASEEKGDVIPHQRLTINNTSALQRSLKSFALPSKLPFSEVQSITSAEPIHIADVEDDLNRESMFYRQSLEAVNEARALLKKEDVPFSRPADYFAEMVKSEEQMGKVRQKMVDEAARKKASADARRQRGLKKFGKAVQVAKLQERDKAKRQTMDKINALKRKRQGADLNPTEDSMFDVALEDAADTEKRRNPNDRAGPNRKRQKKDERFGFGGKKRHVKSNDSKSTGEGRYSVKRMKGKTQRPGKSKRMKAR